MTTTFFVSLLTWAVPAFTPFSPTTAPVLVPIDADQDDVIPRDIRLSAESRAWLDMQLKANPIPYGPVKRRWAKHCGVSVYRLEKFIKGRRRQARDQANNVQGGPSIPTTVEATDPDPVIVAIDIAEDSD